MRYRVCENFRWNSNLKSFYVGDDQVKAWDVYRKQCTLDRYFGEGHGVSLMRWDDRGIGSWQTVIEQA